MLRDIISIKLRKALFEYIIEDMQPLRTVESSAFRKLIGSICPCKLPHWKSFTQHLEKLYDDGQEGERHWRQLMVFQEQLMCGQLITQLLRNDCLLD